MVGTRTSRLWPSEPSPERAFTLAGGLLLMSPTHVVLEAFVGVPLPSWLVAVFVLPGLLAGLAGLASLYPDIQTARPGLARAGRFAAAATGALIIGLLAVVLLRTLLDALAGTTLGLPLGVAFSLLPIGLALVFGSFGLAARASETTSRTTSLLLLGLALPWLGVLVATPLVGDAFPGWLTLALFGPLPFLLLKLATSVRRSTLKTTRADGVTDPVAD